MVPCWDIVVLRWLLGTPAVTWTTELEWNLGKLEFLYQQSQLKCATLLRVFELMLDLKCKEKKSQPPQQKYAHLWTGERV